MTLIIIEVDEDGATVTRLNGIDRILPRIEEDDMQGAVGGGVTIERTLSTTSDDAAVRVKTAVRERLRSERVRDPVVEDVTDTELTTR